MNTAERIFNMVVVLLGMFVFSGVISSLTNSLMTLRKLWEEDSKKFSILRRFLQQQNVPNTLVARIVRYIEYQMSHRTNFLNEGDVDMLKMLTDGLRKELNYEIRIKHLVGHPLFVFIDEATSATINRLIGDMQIVHVAVDDYLFFHQEASEHMYITVRGEFRYLHNGSGQETCVGVKEWLCEAALWTHWMNVGDLRASTESELLGILPKDFGDVVQSNPHIIASCVVYAIAFIEQLRDLRVLSDVFRGSMEDLINYRYQEYVLHESTRSESLLPLKEWCTSRISGRRSSAGWLPIGRIPSINT
jgi:CRP-like cAMP-binding protein